MTHHPCPRRLQLDAAAMGKAAQWSLFANSTLCEAFFGAAKGKKDSLLDVRGGGWSLATARFLPGCWGTATGGPRASCAQSRLPAEQLPSAVRVSRGCMPRRSAARCVLRTHVEGRPIRAVPAFPALPHTCPFPISPLPPFHPKGA